MLAIKPLSSLQLETTQANFPALKFALTADSVIDSDTLRCLISGNEFKRTGKLVNNGDNTFSISDGGTMTINAATLSPVVVDTSAASGSKTLIWFFQQEANSSTILRFNSADYEGLSVGGGAGTFISPLGLTTSFVADTALGASDIARMGIVDIDDAASTFARKSVTTSAIADTTSAALSASGTFDTVWGDLCASDVTLTFTNALTKVGSFFVFEFATKPEDLDEAAVWMSLNPGKVYPAWEGRA